MVDDRAGGSRTVPLQVFAISAALLTVMWLPVRSSLHPADPALRIISYAGVWGVASAAIPLLVSLFVERRRGRTDPGRERRGATVALCVAIPLFVVLISASLLSGETMWYFAVILSMIILYASRGLKAAEES